MGSKLHLIVRGRQKLKDNLLPYVQYLRHLERRYKEQQTLTFGDRFTEIYKNHHPYLSLPLFLPLINSPYLSVPRFTESYKDHLQVPLQPLMDNLESQTYDVFEKDPVKYSLYQVMTI